ncbi:alpha/beta hydrolase [uncultured Serinicoccus sp.]|uniref:alpha/beta hydrolase n=1 Tax=uncultured Serinicoccus sp. TaxID=735514 RepID=UPI00261C891E|nr:alpha/beta hydrolase [uncultured Serinicoccus sp.]
MTRSRRTPWLLLVLGALWVLVPGWIWLTRAGVLLAGHPAYAVAVSLAAVVGVMLLAAGLRRRGAQGRTETAGDAPSRWDGGRRSRWLSVVGGAVAVVLSVLVLGVLAWLRPFAASPPAVALVDGTSEVAVTDSASRITLTPTAQEPTDGLVFQPGARVDPRAYLPLLTEVAADGHLIVVVKQPFDIGFTATGAPGDVIEDHPEIVTWVTGGHSLGGVVASTYAADHPAEVDGLLLWASYPLDDLSGREDLAVATVSGSEDGLATPADIEASLADLPPDAQVVQVAGAVHAFFGDYGEQPGDGTPGTSRAEAQAQIVEASLALLEAAAAP